MSQFKRAKSLQYIGVDEKYPQYCFVKAKQKIIAIFANFIKCLECFINILKRFSDENDIKEDLSKVRLSNVAVCRSAVFSLYFTPGLQSAICVLH